MTTDLNSFTTLNPTIKQFYDFKPNGKLDIVLFPFSKVKKSKPLGMQKPPKSNPITHSHPTMAIAAAAARSVFRSTTVRNTAARITSQSKSTRSPFPLPSRNPLSHRIFR